MSRNRVEALQRKPTSSKMEQGEGKRTRSGNNKIGKDEQPGQQKVPGISYRQNPVQG